MPRQGPKLDGAWGFCDESRTVHVESNLRPPHLVLEPPHRFDLRLRDIVAAALSLARVEPEPALAALRAEIGPNVDAYLSVRSAWAACLQAQRDRGLWQQGDEILMSAVTIRDMARVVEAFGLVPVPIDIDPQTLAPLACELELRMTTRTRAIVVAHLFGARVDLEPIVAFARRHDLLLIEDAAQAFCGPERLRAPILSDLCLYSFGPLKTCTASGGAIAIVRDPALRVLMSNIQARWPKQSGLAFAKKLGRYGALVAAQNRHVYGLLGHLCAKRGFAIGDLVRRAVRGFPAVTDAELIAKISLQPAAAQLQFMVYRLRNFDPHRLKVRKTMGDGLQSFIKVCAPHLVVGAQAADPTYWLFPVATSKPEGLRARLWQCDVDLSSASNVVAIGGERASRLVENLVFIPNYPEISEAARIAIRYALAEHGHETRGEQTNTGAP
jgi:dTDP-4-amino-4,6-dideoxygalactose transaminase